MKNASFIFLGQRAKAKSRLKMLWISIDLLPRMRRIRVGQCFQGYFNVEEYHILNLVPVTVVVVFNVFLCNVGVRFGKRARRH
jgi:hypothetical protein